MFQPSGWVAKPAVSAQQEGSSNTSRYVRLMSSSAAQSSIPNISPTISVLIACHNRRSTTVRALETLRAQRSHARISVVLTDDGSTDGTSAAAEAVFPDIEIVPESGHAYWARSMARAENVALRRDPDFLLWFNDDVRLDPDAIERLLTVATTFPGAIVVGAVRDPASGEITYGGRRRAGRHPQRFLTVPQSGRAQAVDTFNGNVVLVPRFAYQAVGPIDGAFPHAYADDDYGLRAKAVGIPLWLAPGSVGMCERQASPRPSRSLRERWARLQSPKGLPLDAQIRYLRRHGGREWPLYLVWSYARRLAPTYGERR